MCEARTGTNSCFFPVNMFTTPPGTSEEFRTSAKVMEHRGFDSLARQRTVFPQQIAGIIKDTMPSKEVFSGAMMPTNPIASQDEKLKWEEDTGFTVLVI